MAIERVTNLLLIVGIANVCALGMLVVLAFFNLHAYRVLRRLEVLLVLNETEERPVDHRAGKRTQSRPPSEQRPAPQTTRYDSYEDVPDRGQTEWTGPVIPYKPADRV